MGKDTVTETREFHLSEYDKVVNVSYKVAPLRNCNEHGCNLGGITFFQISMCGIITTVHVGLEKELGCKTSKNWFFYLYGRWHFVRDAQDPTLWRAYKMEFKTKN